MTPAEIALAIERIANRMERDREALAVLVRMLRGEPANDVPKIDEADILAQVVQLAVVEGDI